MTLSVTAALPLTLTVSMTLAVSVTVAVCRFITSSGVMSAICDTSVAQGQGPRRWDAPENTIVRIALDERAPPSS